jgi:hypothetical protein
VQPILYRGRPFSVAGRIWVHPHPSAEALAARDKSYPLVRFVGALALHAFEIDAGLIADPLHLAAARAVPVPSRPRSALKR